MSAPRHAVRREFRVRCRGTLRRAFEHARRADILDHVPRGRAGRADSAGRKRATSAAARPRTCSAPRPRGSPGLGGISRAAARCASAMAAMAHERPAHVRGLASNRGEAPSRRSAALSSAELRAPGGEPGPRRRLGLCGTRSTAANRLRIIACAAARTCSAGEALRDAPTKYAVPAAHHGTKGRGRSRRHRRWRGTADASDQKSHRRRVAAAQDAGVQDEVRAAQLGEAKPAMKSCRATG